MPRIQPLLPLLRQLPAPRPLCRFSTASRLRIPQPSPAQSSSEAPIKSPKEAARAADLAAAEAATDADNPNAPAPKPVLPSKRSHTTIADHVQPSSTSNPATSSRNSRPAAPLVTLELPPPKYHVGRTSTKNLPVYSDYKRGGNLHLTTIRKITGDISELRDELRVFLNKKDEDVKINSLTQHVIVKGHHVPQVTDFLKARGM
ncbi:hypothetical protein GRF29_103g1055776 [Pseudopithomyces chartarum]|uniref:Large ribosomal subunit protein mL49 n=1 Tax=Pseudopithomyces chartarum TaxID=1892770 RepID=A0AAN6LVC1_9PLEO|nr:hypothetical protein GRF29_103g1055776 [Pseudopithomyces chartarum]